jgi:hypothetical protein
MDPPSSHVGKGTPPLPHAFDRFMMPTTTKLSPVSALRPATTQPVRAVGKHVARPTTTPIPPRTTPPRISKAPSRSWVALPPVGIGPGTLRPPSADAGRAPARANPGSARSALDSCAFVATAPKAAAALLYAVDWLRVIVCPRNESVGGWATFTMERPLVA